MLYEREAERIFMERLENGSEIFDDMREYFSKKRKTLNDYYDRMHIPDRVSLVSDYCTERGHDFKEIYSLLEETREKMKTVTESHIRAAMSAIMVRGAYVPSDYPEFSEYVKKRIKLVEGDT